MFGTDRLTDLYTDDADALRRAQALVAVNIVLSALMIVMTAVSLGIGGPLGLDAPAWLQLGRLAIWLAVSGVSFIQVRAGNLAVGSYVHAVGLWLGVALSLVAGQNLLGTGAVLFLTVGVLYLTTRDIGVLTGLYGVTGLIALLTGTALLPTVVIPVVVGVAMFLVSNQVTRTVRRSDRRTRALETVFELNNLITSIVALDDMLKAVVNRIRDEFAFSRVRVYLVEEGQQLLSLRAGVEVDGSLSPAERFAINEESLPGLTALRREVTVEESDVKGSFRRVDAGFPLLLGNTLLGVLVVASTRITGLSNTERFTLQTLAGQLATAVDNARTLGSEASVLEATSPVFRATKEIATALDVDSILNVLRAQIAEDVDRITLISVGFGAVGEPVTNVLACWDRDGLEVDAEFPEAVRAYVGPRTLVVPNVATLHEDAKALRDYARHILRSKSFVILPLSVRDRTVGYMLLAYYEPRDYTERELRTLQAMAGQVGVVLDNLTLLDTLSGQASRLGEVNDMSYAAIATRSIDDLEEVLRRSLRTAVDFVHLSYSRHDGATTASLITLVKGKDSVRISERVPMAGSALQQAYNRGTTLRLTEIPRADLDTWVPESVHSLLLIPMHARNERIGTLNIGLTAVTELDGNHILLMEQIAAVFAHVLEKNTHLQQLTGQLEEATSLYSTTLAMNAAQNLREVYETALTEMAHLSGAARLVLYLAGPDPRETIEFVLEAATLEHGELRVDAQPIRYRMEDAPIVSQFPLSRANLVFNSAATDPRLTDALRDAFGVRGVNAVMMLPLATGTTWLGVIIGERYEGTFNTDSIRLSRSLADQTALAVDSHSLLARSQQAVARERALRDVISRIRGATDRETVMAIAAEEVAEAFGISPDEAELITGRTSQRYALDPSSRELVQSISSQVELALQNLALIEATEQTALREQTVNEVMAEVARALTVEEVMRSAVQLLNVSLADYDVALRLTADQRRLPDGLVDNNGTEESASS